jgi:DNA-binding beta-propeller fold protein YncE
VAVVVVAMALTPSSRAVWQAPADAPAWPAPPDEARVKYVTSIGKPADVGAGPNVFGRLWGLIAGRDRQPQLLRPSAVATTASGRVVVSDTEQQMVHVFDPARRRYSYLESAPFASPVGLAVAPDETTVVADSGRRRVFVYSKAGKLRATLGLVNGEPIFVRPTAVALGPDGLLYVLDSVAASVTAMTLQGRVERVFGHRGSGPGEFNFPTHMTFGRDGRLYIVDALNARIQILERDGTLVGAFGARGNGTGNLDKPKGVALDADGHVYVAESIHDVFQIFDTSGRLLLVVGGTGTGPGQFGLPAGLHIDGAGRIYVADSLNHRVQVFQYVSRSDAN